MKGDRLPLFDEYRGIFINGVHRRLDQATDHFGGSSGGPDSKDAFFIDNAGIPDGTNLMRILGLSWHRIREGEMDPRQTRRTVRGTTFREAGAINFNSPLGRDRSGYKAIRIVDDPSLGEDLGIAPLSVVDGAPARLNLNQIAATARVFGLTAAQLDQIIGLVAGHEVGHKVLLRHPPNNIRQYVSAPIAPDGAGRVDDTKYWLLGPNDLQGLTPGRRQTAVATWVPVTISGAQFGTLEDAVTRMPGTAVDATVMARVTRSDGDHDAVILKFVVDRLIDPSAPNFDATTAPLIEMYTHAGFMSDHIPDFLNPQTTINVVEGERIDVTK